MVDGAKPVVLLVRNQKREFVVKRCTESEWEILNFLPPFLNIIKFVDKEQVGRFIVMPFMTFLPHTEHEKLFENNTAEFCNQLLQGLNFLHNNRVAHRNIDPRNIVINLSCGTILEITGFGNAKLFPDDSESRDVVGKVGNPEYRAPEVSDNIPYDAFAADKYSAGKVVLFITSYSPHSEMYCLNVAVMSGNGGCHFSVFPRSP